MIIKASRLIKKKSAVALMSSVRENREDMQPLYDRICAGVSEDSFLSERILNVLVVVKPESVNSEGKVFPKAFQVWVIHESEPAVEREMGMKLSALVEGKLLFACSGNLKINYKKDGVDIVDEMPAS